MTPTVEPTRPRMDSIPGTLMPTIRVMITIPRRPEEEEVSCFNSSTVSIFVVVIVVVVSRDRHGKIEAMANDYS